MAVRRQKATARTVSGAATLLSWPRHRIVPRSYLESDDPDVRTLAELTQEAVSDVRRLVMTGDANPGERDRALAVIYSELAAARRAYAEPRRLAWAHPGRR